MSSPESSAKPALVIRIFLLASLSFVPSVMLFGQDTLSRQSPENLLAQARKLQYEKNYRASIQYYEAYLRQYANDDDVRNELARTFSWNAEYDSALATYERVLQRNRDNFDARFGKCLVLGWQKNYGEALVEIDSLLARFPRNVDVLLAAGRLNLWDGNYETSLELYERAVSLDPENLEASLGQCRALLATGRKTEAYEEVSILRERYPNNNDVLQLSLDIEPPPANQFFVRFQNESFDVQNRSEQRTFQAQYYRIVMSGLTLYAEVDAYRRFDQDDQSFGIGGYYTIDTHQSLYGYVLASPDPKVTSSVDATIEYTRVLSRPFAAFLAYRLLSFKTETANVFSPGFSWNAVRDLEFKPRVYISRTVIARTTSYAFSVQSSFNGWQNIMPYLYYTVGNEAYRGVTLDNVESSASWSLTIGCKYDVSEGFVVRANYQYLNRIGYFHENSIDIGLGYYW
jgi:YaiO family outer membrane protein